MYYDVLSLTEAMILILCLQGDRQETAEANPKLAPPILDNSLPKKRSTMAGDTQPDLNLQAVNKTTSNTTRDSVSCAAYNNNASTMIDKHLDAPSKWKSHMQTNTRPTDEDNCNVYQRNNDTGKSLPPPPLQAQFDQTQIDHADIMV